jgi:hypothetical protein
MKRLIFISLLLISNIGHGGIFGSSNYEECVLDGLKNTNTDSSVRLLRETCQKKFQKDYEKTLKNCSLTWNGKTYKLGIPENIDLYTTITFRGTIDVIYIPNNMMEMVTQSFILKEKKRIQSLCPGINFDLQDKK